VHNRKSPTLFNLNLGSKFCSSGPTSCSLLTRTTTFAKTPLFRTSSTIATKTSRLRNTTRPAKMVLCCVLVNQAALINVAAREVLLGTSMSSLEICSKSKLIRPIQSGAPLRVLASTIQRGFSKTCSIKQKERSSDWSKVIKLKTWLITLSAMKKTKATEFPSWRISMKWSSSKGLKSKSTTLKKLWMQW